MRCVVMVTAGAIGLWIGGGDLPAGASGVEVRIRPGWDWSLPASVEPTSYSGYITWGPKRFARAITVRGIMATWKRLNPAPGVYRWDWLERQIAASEKAGMRVGIHLKGVQRDAVPDWVVERYHPVVVDAPPLQPDQPWRIQNVLPWQPDVDREFHRFLKAFGRTGIPQRDVVVYGYIHGISASRGEEMFIREIDLRMWQETTGLTAEMFADWLKRRIDAMCEAFRGVEYKLALVFSGPLGPTPEFRRATAGLAAYAISRGTGIRGGGIDFMHALYNAPAWGSRLENGYCIVDDEHPTIRENRFRGDENEEYGKYWEWRFGPVAGHAYRHRICVLRGLQMRQNFEVVSPATLALDPELDEYARIVMGYRRQNSPDAWAYLRETFPRVGPVHNIERWLIQRERPGSRTIPAERIDRAPVPGDKPGFHYDFDARRTDVAHGQNGILFRLDRSFWSRPEAARVKVTFLDRVPTRWRLAYTDASGRNVRTPLVENTGDGKRKTATFLIPSLAAAGRFPDDPVFEAWLAGLPPPRNLLRTERFRTGGRGGSLEGLYRIEADAGAQDGQGIHFRYKRFAEDTPHADQIVELRKGVVYRLAAEIRRSGRGLRPAVRVARMDWSTIVYLPWRDAGGRNGGAWQRLEYTFESPVDGRVRVQLFGQGRGNQAPGLQGESWFRNVVLRPLSAEEVRRFLGMDFRIETVGPGDLTVSFVRVIRGRLYRSPTGGTGRGDR